MIFPLKFLLFGIFKQITVNAHIPGCAVIPAAWLLCDKAAGSISIFSIAVPIFELLQRIGVFLRAVAQMTGLSLDHNILVCGNC